MSDTRRRDTRHALAKQERPTKTSTTKKILAVAAFVGLASATTAASAQGGRLRAFVEHHFRHHQRPVNVQVGPRPYYLVDNMDDGALKDQLLSCAEQTMRPSQFSIGHRGAALQFPEETAEAIEAGARMGAGILECDVTFTKDRELVCRRGGGWREGDGI